ncbi:MAG TPA: hypothetical protein VNY08_24370 [Bradyrhizobium sp.]|jgi:hypothetical protein|nr:hypothetical protein [Bradyrhizobium sp.]
MSISERSPESKRLLRWPMPSEMVLLAAIAVVIVVLHVVAGSLLHPGSTRGPTAPLEDARASSID